MLCCSWYCSFTWYTIYLCLNFHIFTSRRLITTFSVAIIFWKLSRHLFDWLLCSQQYIKLTIYISVHRSIPYMSINLFPTCPSIYSLHVHRYIPYMSIDLFIYLSIHLFIYLLISIYNMSTISHCVRSVIWLLCQNLNWDIVHFITLD